VSSAGKSAEASSPGETPKLRETAPLSPDATPIEHPVSSAWKPAETSSPGESQKPREAAALSPDATPDATPIEHPVSSAGKSAEASSPGETPKPADKAAQKATNNALQTKQPSISRGDLLAKHPGKSSTHVAVAKIEAAAVGVATEKASQPLGVSTPANADKEAVAPKPIQPLAEPPAAAPAPASSDQQPLDRVLHAFGDMFGARPTPVPQPVDPTPSTAPTGWSVQLAAPKSEAEASGDLERLNAKYASALNGSTIGIYRPSSTALQSTDCASLAYPRPRLRRFARSSRAMAAIASSPSEKARGPGRYFQSLWAAARNALACR
jgi:hypothetical protein